VPGQLTQCQLSKLRRHFGVEDLKLKKNCVRHNPRLKKELICRHERLNIRHITLRVGTFSVTKAAFLGNNIIHNLVTIIPGFSLQYVMLFVKELSRLEIYFCFNNFRIFRSCSFMQRVTDMNLDEDRFLRHNYVDTNWRVMLNKLYFRINILMICRMV
jgi:hypothetical protein